MSIVIEGRRVVKKGGKYYVYSEDYKKKLGGPFDTKDEALKRLGAVEYYKHKEGRASPWGPDREVRSIAAEVRVKETDAGPVIHGYGSVYGRDSQVLTTGEGRAFVERIHPEAFARVLASGPDVRALGNHDPNMILGRTRSGTLRVESDDAGLRYEINPPKSAIGDHFVEAVRRGDMDGSSFSFTVDPGGDEWDHSTTPPTRTVRSVRDLFDVGPVTFPAYLDASAALRSMDRSRPTAPPADEAIAYRQRIARLRLVFPSFAIPTTTKG